MTRVCSSCIFIVLLLAACFPAHAQQRFGTSVLVAGNHVLVGEPENVYRPGAVYVYGNEGSGWTRVEELVAPNARMGDHFGRSLAFDGRRLLVGSTGLEGEVGAAYVFERGADQRWQQTATLSVSDAVADDGYGAAVAIFGDFAFVGAPSRKEEPGSVYVFARGADGSWSQSARLSAGAAEARAGFGRSIAAEDGTVYIGAPGAKDGTGAVHVFSHAGSEWDEVSVLGMRAMAEGSGLGTSLDLHGDLLVAGAAGHSSRIGAAVMFHRNPETRAWTNATLLQPYAANNFHGFGTSVAVDGDEVFVGAPTAASFAGTGYAFRLVDGDWIDVARLPDAERQSRDFFGSSLDLSGGLALVGVTGDDFGAGSVVLYRRSGDSWVLETELKSEGGGLDPIVGGQVECDGGAAALFDCNNVDMLSFLPIRSIGGERGVELNDIWGWTDPETDREYALVGRVDGTSFVDVTDPSNPVYLGNLPKTEGSPGSTWRDIKVYKNHAYVVADGAANHGMQVFDLTQLRDVADAPVVFEETAHYDRINSAHNIVIDEESGFAYAVGSSGGGETCGGGLHMINIQDPLNPEFAGCFSDPGTGRAGTGYSHDAQCLVYRGPDSKYQGRQICFGSNETALSIADVTDKQSPVAVSSAAYPNVSYTHQGWISEDHRYFYVNDELDELSGNAPETRTLIWDISDLDDPQLVKEYMWGPTASDHNLYIRGNLMYQSNYASGLRIHDISDPENPVEVGYFDTMPVGDNGPGLSGSWSNYPYFASGTIAVSSIGEGLFLLRKQKELGL